VEPVTATLPVVPASVQSGVPPLDGAAVGHEPAAIAVPDDTNVRTKAAPTTVEYTRENFTAVTLPVAYPSTTVAPLPGTWVMPRRRGCSGRSLVGRAAPPPNKVLSTMRISYSANAAPRQRRTPPPKGIQV